LRVEMRGKENIDRPFFSKESKVRNYLATG
jgi:hypothetical protein